MSGNTSYESHLLSATVHGQMLRMHRSKNGCCLLNAVAEFAEAIPLVQLTVAGAIADAKMAKTKFADHGCSSVTDALANLQPQTH